MTEHIVTADELKRLQKVQLKLIAEVDRVCKKCGIRYQMVGDTMLGAIRHQGYIPWDDDADIGFLRSEYEKFRVACRLELKPEFYMQDLRDTPGYRWGYGKLRMKNTEFVRLGQEFMPFDKGISIDLMPFDNVPDGYFSKRLHFVKCFLFRKILWSEVGKRNEKNPLKRILYKIINQVSMTRVVEYFQKFIDDCQNIQSAKTVRILTFPTPDNIFGYERLWYEELLEYPFENLLLPGAMDYDGYLTAKYGNYMVLPPPKKRKIHPVSKLTLPPGD